MASSLESRISAGGRITSTDIKIDGRNISETSGPDCESVCSGKGLGNFEKSRLMDVLIAVQHLARLRSMATTASVLARQKKREVKIKRQIVWITDGKFMEEIQKLAAQGKFEGLEELEKLAFNCQQARDNLGPIEQESIETEQEWEGQAWTLRQAEAEFEANFQYELELAESLSLSSGSSPSNSSENRSDAFRERNEHESEANSSIAISNTFQSYHYVPEDNPLVRPIEAQAKGPKSLDLSGIDIAEESSMPLEAYVAASESGSNDIDKRMSMANMDRGGVPGKAATSTYESYPHLITDFASTRERINKWLEKTVLSSHLESTLLFSILTQELQTENQLPPSNWAQLVIAYWGNDEAAVSARDRTQSDINTADHNWSEKHPEGSLSVTESVSSHLRDDKQDPDKTPTITANARIAPGRIEHCKTDPRIVDGLPSRSSSPRTRGSLSDSTGPTLETITSNHTPLLQSKHLELSLTHIVDGDGRWVTEHDNPIKSISPHPNESNSLPPKVLSTGSIGNLEPT